MAVCVLILMVVFVPMTVFLFKYRRSRPANRRWPRINTLMVEISWSAAVLVLACGIFVWGAYVYVDIQHPPAKAIDVYVVGRQWMWKFQHPNGRREINQLHVPVGEVIRLTMTSQDVIHSFFVPAFRVKQDVVPGRYLSQWFETTRPGTYHLFCAEYCGNDHSRMVGAIHVMERSDYERWMSGGPVRESMAAAGERLFRQVGCSGCHMGPSVIRAPPLEGLFGSPVPLQDQTVVTADESYLRDSILLPQLQVVAGYEPLMPSYQGVLAEEQVFQLVAYIKSLGSAPAPEQR
jgi:cytochrome c oxidase subunit 2